MKSFRQVAVIFYQNLELLTWVGAMVVLMFSSAENHHYTLCPLDNLGVSSCPGCGLGRSVSFALHGDLAASIQMHPFGLLAVIVIFYRIITLIFNFFQFNHFKTLKS